jgi:hypothetical protein
MERVRGPGKRYGEGRLTWGEGGAVVTEMEHASLVLLPGEDDMKGKGEEIVAKGYVPKRGRLGWRGAGRADLGRRGEGKKC